MAKLVFDIEQMGARIVLTKGATWLRLWCYKRKQASRRRKRSDSLAMVSLGTGTVCPVGPNLARAASS